MSFCVREKLLGFFTLCFCFLTVMFHFFHENAPAPSNARLKLKKRTGCKTTTSICTGVNTAKNNPLNGCLRVAFDFCCFFGNLEFEFSTSLVRFLQKR